MKQRRKGTQGSLRIPLRFGEAVSALLKVKPQPKRKRRHRQVAVRRAHGSAVLR